MISRARHFLGHLVLILAQLFFVLLFVKLFIADVAVVDGQSMEPILIDGELFVIDRFSYFLHPPRRGDIVQLIDPEYPEEVLIKRVIAVSGDELVFKRQSVYMRGKSGQDIEIEESYLMPNEQTLVPYGLPTSYIVPDNWYFVIGDNRDYSRDSRHFGVISRRNILGNVLR